MHSIFIYVSLWIDSSFWLFYRFVSFFKFATFNACNEEKPNLLFLPPFLFKAIISRLSNVPFFLQLAFHLFPDVQSEKFVTPNLQCQIKRKRGKKS